MLQLNGDVKDYARKRVWIRRRVWVRRGWRERGEEEADMKGFVIVDIKHIYHTVENIRADE